jgi:hypothetical protein
VALDGKVANRVAEALEDEAMEEASKGKRISLAFSTPAPVPDAFFALRGACKAALPAIEEGGGLWSPVPIPVGAGVFMEIYGEYFERVMNILVSHLERAGFSGEFVPFTGVVERPEVPWTEPGPRGVPVSLPVDLFECRLSVRGAARAVGARGSVWEVHSSVVSRMVDEAVAWCQPADQAEHSNLDSACSVIR